MIFNTYNLRLIPLIDELSREFHGVYSLARSNSSIDAKSIRTRSLAASLSPRVQPAGTKAPEAVVSESKATQEKMCFF